MERPTYARRCPKRWLAPGPRRCQPPCRKCHRCYDKLLPVTDSARVYVGTSGYNYPEWRGSFYPEKFAADKMLAFYAERFRTVEVNYTFYRMPTEKLLTGWA